MLKVAGGSALKITKATNPVANDTDTMETSENDNIEPPPWKKPRLLSKRSQRRKKTVPKLQEDTGNMHVQMSALNTPPVTPPNGCTGQGMELELMKGIRSSSYEEEDLPLDVLVNMENYRRFSSRTRKKPDFFHVSQMVPADELQPQKTAAEMKRNVSVPPARRMLRFEPVKQEEDASAPSSLEEVEEKDLKPDKPDDVEVC